MQLEFFPLYKIMGINKITKQSLSILISLDSKSCLVGCLAFGCIKDTKIRHSLLTYRVTWGAWQTWPSIPPWSSLKTESLCSNFCTVVQVQIKMGWWGGGGGKGGGGDGMVGRRR